MAVSNLSHLTYATSAPEAKALRALGWVTAPQTQRNPDGVLLAWERDGEPVVPAEGEKQ